MSNIRSYKANLNDPCDADAIIYLLDAYARDEMGGGESLSQYAKDNLIKELNERSFCNVFIACIDDKPVGLATTFEGFSTFAAKPLINIHDIAVLPEYRGKGVGQVLLQEVEDFARSRGCCKLTLEVLQGNIIAQKAYSKFGFAGYELGDGLGHAMFWQKKLK